MLTELKISNFAIIENQSIPFGSGLNVITGETGSGKSIILNALELILGGRSSTGYIRAGCDGLEVQAHFDLSGISPEIMQNLPEIARAEEIVVSRLLNASGKGKVYINGNLGTVSLLSEIGSKLINICSQSQQIRLLDSRFHLELLDGFIGDQSLLDHYQEIFFQWVEKKKLLQDIEQKYAERESRIVWLQETVSELAALKLRSGIRAELEVQVRRFSNAQRILDTARQLQDVFSESDGINSCMGSVAALLSDLLKVDPAIQKVSSLFQSAKMELQEFEREFTRYISSIETDEDHLNELSETLTEIARLERKYKTDDSGLIALLDNAQAELKLLGGEKGADDLRKEVEALRRLTIEKGEELSTLRRKRSKELSKLVAVELAELNMGGAKLEVSFEPSEPHANGIDSIEFMIAPNKGEPPKPLKQIASGGELSRIMLVLKKILRERSGVNVLVFDEVDTGISGSVARAVGQKLQALAHQSQVICITHLAQVASFADKHLRVDKRVGSRTVSTISELSSKERVDEIARMLAGFEVTPAARASAKELIATAHRR